MEEEAVSSSVPQSSPNEFARRPNFVSKYKLARLYSCGLCKEILVQPQQTPCGYRVCKECIDKVFGDKEDIPCPFSHDEEPCQQEGVGRSDVCNDPAVHNRLLREECFCPNQPFGCATEKPWKLLQAHIQSCEFTPEPCRNTGCPEKVSVNSKLRHQAECLYSVTSCSLCKETMARKDLKDHIEKCERSCKTCSRVFDRADKLLVHQRIHEPCITEAGKCFYYHYCMFEATSVEQLKTHMKDKKDQHLEALVNTICENKEHAKENIRKAVNAKVKPLEKVTAEIAMEVRRLADRQESSETNARTVAHNSQQIEQVTGKLAVIERQIKDSGLDRVNVIESHSQNIRRHNEVLNDLEARMKGCEISVYDGILLWRIRDYRRKRADAVRGRQRSIYSSPFYTSRHGYKMCCEAFLNGDESSRGKYLSLHLVVMRGEFDEWLRFPFKQRVTFSLLCRYNRSPHITQSFVPDGIGPFPANHPMGRNISPVCSKFALQSKVESSDFLNSDSILIKVVVAPGGDDIP